MRILFAIAHYYHPHSNSRHSSQRPDPEPRVRALARCIQSIHQLFGKKQWVLNIAKKAAFPIAEPQAYEVDVRVCTTQDRHLLDRVPLRGDAYVRQPTEVEPLWLGFACQHLLGEALGQYDYYCYLEDDLVFWDPWFFIKLHWFAERLGDENLLQPNRYTASASGVATKAYLDGDLPPRFTERFGTLEKPRTIAGSVLGVPICFDRALNPHSGCYFLNRAQMERWVRQPDFGKPDASFVGPLESAATLGILKNFRVFKPAPPYMNFLEIEHACGGTLEQFIERGFVLRQEDSNPKSNVSPPR